MAKPHLLIVDSDPRSLRVLEVSLRKAGYIVTAVESGREALDVVSTSGPDLIISDTRLADPDLDGFALCQRLKTNPEWAVIPFIFLSNQKQVEDKVRGLELGVDDYLTKPIYVKEIVTRVRILLERRLRQSLEDSATGRQETRTKFTGNLADMAVVDLLQTIDISRKSGIVHVRAPDGRRGAIYFREGRVVDAEVGHVTGDEAVYKLLIWTEGEFEVEFKQVRRREVIDTPTQGLLMEGMRRVDEWGRLTEQLPPLDTILDIDDRRLADRLAEIPDEVNSVLRLIDGRRSILQVVDDSALVDLEALNVLSKLYFEGLVFDVRNGVQAGQAEWLEADPTDADSQRAFAAAAAERAPDSAEPLATPATEEAAAGAEPPPVPAAAPPLAKSTPPTDEAAVELSPELLVMAEVHATPPGARKETPGDRGNGKRRSGQLEAARDGKRRSGELGGREEGRRSGEMPAAQAPRRRSGQIDAAAPLDRAPEEAADAPTAVDPPVVPSPSTPAMSPQPVSVPAPPLPEAAPPRGLHLFLAALAVGAIGAIVWVVGMPSPRVTGTDLPPLSAEVAAPPATAAPIDAAAALAAERPPSPPDLAPSSPNPPTDSSAAQEYRRLLTEAKKLHRRNRLAAAVQLLEEAVALNPAGDEAYVELANLHLEQGQTGKASQDADLAVAANPSSADAHLVRGAVYQQQRRNAQARAEYQLYLKLAPRGEFAREIRQILPTLR